MILMRQVYIKVIYLLSEARHLITVSLIGIGKLWVKMKYEYQCDEERRPFPLC